jgi:hypothetical protein
MFVFVYERRRKVFEVLSVTRKRFKICRKPFMSHSLYVLHFDLQDILHIIALSLFPPYSLASSCPQYAWFPSTMAQRLAMVNIVSMLLLLAKQVCALIHFIIIILLLL